MSKKLAVLTTYFNQRESEMQKQLGVTSNRLTDTETSSESSAKRATLLNDEVESLRAQIRTLTTEMEEQERSLKSQVRYHSITLSLFQACNLKGCIG